ncbi:MAG: phosphoenolpyruvate carboxylase [Candidatus Thermoplasmatota archaeon]|nr:phosphoenolpyruvate carboxylase [Candidatus Thermoplasmatota archaeon]
MSSKLPVPRAMSTQHPDNVSIPFFAEGLELGGEDEIQEAYYAFSHLGCDEQMWDCEGKEVDNFVVKKLLTKYESFFAEHKIGKELFLTLRVPNPSVEKAEGKVLLETLESIPRSFDVAQLFYKEDLPPIFEIILPMTSSSQELDRIYRYYSDFVVGKQDKKLKSIDITIGNWIGSFKPEKINIIPLFEDLEHLLAAHTIMEKYLEDKNIEYQRVFLARSDPAMNYGLVSAVLLSKIALQRLYNLAESINIDLYPILGLGCPPFRGNLTPKNVENTLKEYSTVHTFTIQSSFKYDNSPEEVRAGIMKLKGHSTKAPQQIDEKKSIELIHNYSQEYRKQIKILAPVINEIAKYVPSRRKRKLHIGLFGYARSVGGIALPRAITFTSALYSIGLPPELLAINALTEKELEFVREVYINFENDLKDALRYLNKDSLRLLPELESAINNLSIDFESVEEHKVISANIVNALKHSKSEELREYITRAANLRKFLG